MELKNLTDKELAMIQSLFHNHYGENGDGIWSHCSGESSKPHGLQSSSVPGVISSLVRKGLMYSDLKQPGEPAGVIGLLPAGQALAAEAEEEAELARLDAADRGDFDDPDDDGDSARQRGREEAAAAHREEF